MKKYFLRTVAATSLITMTFGLSVFAAPQKMSDGNTFDPEFYASTYPDVKAALGTDPNALYQHYLTFGKKEGRLPYASNKKASTSTQATNTTDTANATKIMNETFMYGLTQSAFTYETEIYAAELNAALTGHPLKTYQQYKRYFSYEKSGIVEETPYLIFEETRTPLKNGKTKRTTQYTGDPQDVWIVGPIDAWVDYNIAYNADGTVNTLIPKNDPDSCQTWHFAYDALGRVTDAVSTRNNDSGSFLYHMDYDKNNRIATMQYGISQYGKSSFYRTYTFSYDAAGNLISATGSNPAIVWKCAYTNGNLASVEQWFYQNPQCTSGDHYTTKMTYY